MNAEAIHRRLDSFADRTHSVRSEWTGRRGREQFARRPETATDRALAVWCAAVRVGNGGRR
jgi:hypothetical protein